MDNNIYYKYPIIKEHPNQQESAEYKIYSKSPQQIQTPQMNQTFFQFNNFKRKSTPFIANMKLIFHPNKYQIQNQENQSIQAQNKKLAPIEIKNPKTFPKIQQSNSSKKLFECENKSQQNISKTPTRNYQSLKISSCKSINKKQMTKHFIDGALMMNGEKATLLKESPTMRVNLSKQIYEDLHFYNSLQQDNINHFVQKIAIPTIHNKFTKKFEAKKKIQQ